MNKDLQGSQSLAVTFYYFCDGVLDLMHTPALDYIYHVQIVQELYQSVPSINYSWLNRADQARSYEEFLNEVANDLAPRLYTELDAEQRLDPVWLAYMNSLVERWSLEKIDASAPIEPQLTI